MMTQTKLISIFLCIFWNALCISKNELPPKSNVQNGLKKIIGEHLAPYPALCK